MSRLAPAHFAKLATLVLFGACGDGGTSPTGNGGTTTPVVSSVVISVSEVTLTSLGETVTLTAQARDAAGNPLSGKTFTWASSNAGVATVSTTGFADDHGLGAESRGLICDESTPRMTPTEWGSSRMHS